MKQTEHQLQSMCVRWFRCQYPKMQSMLFAVPNGVFFGAGSTKAFAYSHKLKEEGVLNGVSDLILLIGNGEYNSLCIEMKVGTNKQREEQKLWQIQAECYRNKYVVCRSFDEFQNIINEYLCTQSKQT